MQDMEDQAVPFRLTLGEFADARPLGLLTQIDLDDDDLVEAARLLGPGHDAVELDD
ncbi:hypothetical protein AB0D59_50905 [Streptomyces sp. NPDC048417]|uniref:hypothetical protein n=1 Tax=Streptomyces sp. NPDC048417 TaxID=3155387 RepID=UPI003431C7E5